MPIEFSPSARPTVGVELELQLVDQVSGAAVGAATDVIGRTDENLDADGRVKHELFESMVEVITGVCETVGEVRADLCGTLHGLLAVTDEAELGVLSAGTHPFAHWRDLEVSGEPRYRALVDDLGWPVRRLAISGTHVHVGVPSGETAIPLVHSLTFHLPLFVALSASSPFWHGLDTGLASCRTKVFEGLPTAGLPPHVSDWDDFRTFMDALMGAGVIKSVRDVWWDVRPHPDFGTVELRMCDAITNLDDTVAVAALAQCLVAELTDRVAAGDPLPMAREWILRENKWLAARHGLDTAFLTDDRGTRVPAAELVASLVARLAPYAEVLDCTAELASVGDLVARGASYVHQRRVVAAGGDHRDVVTELVAEFRRSVER